MVLARLLAARQPGCKHWYFAESKGAIVVIFSRISAIFLILFLLSAQAQSAWFNVVTYGATGNGSTDDTTAINSAIAAFNSAGSGVLYFPAGDYRTSGGLMPISAGGIVQGDGTLRLLTIDFRATLVRSDSNTNSLFTVTSDRLMFRDMAILNDAVSTPTAGAGITITGSGVSSTQVDYDNLYCERFFNCIDVQSGAQWSLRNSLIAGPVNYGIRIRNVVVADAGDWSITDSAFYSSHQNAAAAIRIESSGGGKIVNVKVNDDATSVKFVHAIDVAPSSPTSILLVSNSSFENVSGVALNVSSSSSWNLIAITGNEFGMYDGNTNAAISIAGQNYISITGNLIVSTASAAAAISLTSCDKVTAFGNVTMGFTNTLATSNVTNLAGINSPIGSGSIVTPGTYTNPTLTIEADGRISSATNGVGSTGSTWSSTVSGSSSQNLTITGLNLAADKLYSCEFSLKDASGTAAVLSVFFDGDAVPTNYERQNTISSGSGVSTGRANNSQIAQFSASQQMMGLITVGNDFDGRPRAIFSINNGAVSSLVRIDSALAYAVSANLTSLTISSNTAAGFAVGSQITCKVN